MEHPLETLGSFFAGLGTFAIGIAAIITATKTKRKKKRRRK